MLQRQRILNHLNNVEQFKFKDATV